MMKLFDARTLYGTKFMHPHVQKSLADHLDACGADKAIVVMQEQLYLPPDQSLEIVKERVINCKNTLGLAVMAPACSGELPSADEIAKRFPRGSFGGFLLVPVELRLPLKPVFFASELEVAAKLEIPVIYHANSDAAYIFASDVLSEYPNLNMVLSFEDEWPNVRKIYPMLSAFSNLHICLSEFVWMGGVEDFCSRYGSRRLLYSSSFPNRYPGGSMLMISNADIVEEEKSNIYWRNLDNLIGGMQID